MATTSAAWNSPCPHGIRCRSTSCPAALCASFQESLRLRFVSSLQPLFGLGLSVVSFFGRYRFPTMPRTLSGVGLLVGIGMIIHPLWPLKPLAAIAATLAVLSTVAALILQVSLEKSEDKSALDSPNDYPEADGAPNIKGHNNIMRGNLSIGAEPKIHGDGNDFSYNTTIKGYVPDSLNGPTDPKERFIAEMLAAYFAENPEIDRGSVRIPPDAFMNAELARRGNRWRVKTVGGTIDIIDGP